MSTLTNILSHSSYSNLPYYKRLWCYFNINEYINGVKISRDHVYYN